MRLGYLRIAPAHCWRHPIVQAHFWGWWYLFTNRKEILPGRWGFGIMGLIEFGSRNSQDPIGVWLKNHSLWPW